MRGSRKNSYRQQWPRNVACFKTVFVWGIFGVLVSCNTTRMVPKGDALYTGAEIKITTAALPKKERTRLKTELETLVRPLPNKRVLGVPFKLHMYNLGGNATRGLRKWVKNKMGEPPVLASKVNVDWNVNVMQNNLENQGYFRAKVDGDTILYGKKAKALYDIGTGARYVINNVSFQQDSSYFYKELSKISLTTFLKEGDPFSLNVIKAERERIDQYLKDNGFYYFDPDYLIIETDSSIGNHRVNLYVNIKPSTPVAALKPYSINNIYLYPGYRLNANASDTSEHNAVNYMGLNIIDRRNTYKPKMFAQTVRFDKGDVYNRNDHNQSISRLINLGVFKFVRNRFEPADTTSGLLDVHYYLTSSPKKSIKFDLNASTKSNNLTGSSVTVGWRNRNVFKAGELLSINATGGFEVQFSGQLQGFNTYRGGVDAQLSFPRFIIPFFPVNTRSGFIPKTNVLIAYDLLSKENLYTMNSFRAGFGYAWKETINKEHQLNLLSVNYAQPTRITELYEHNMQQNPLLQKAVEKQFILGTNYNYNYNQLNGKTNAQGFFFNGNADFSGNVAGVLTGANVNSNNQKTILGAAFAQYVKVETDFRYYLKLNKQNIWANRLIVGVGYPYGNSSALPFIKQFFAGGNNSIRAFRSRSLGPGAFFNADQINILSDQSGDIKLEFSSELRAKLFSIVHGALFVDAGNIWLYNDDPNIPGGKFTNSFMDELAVGAGAGLRFDITFLVLRLDVAFPLRKPWLPENERWVTSDINLGNSRWRRDNLVFNIGIGYPF